MILNGLMSPLADDASLSCLSCQNFLFDITAIIFTLFKAWEIDVKTGWSILSL